ncbi:putative lipid II flippase FtsW [Paenibacillus radicis (ex Gao et al. 2016)]|uniref:Probable peptidoglycan glycosyltransferase FtsW n=1 Tax=Paenibacillus radicis (ex Gao et al. 2016) TaxID=1737354 RepID=A0A917MBD5_9BACL|nr:putative lipid II flippase FtsW [Paenibacillus radicis (ex Gao et al. 2016)]GGG89517.1 stage V sporulation protein E [Paenibacillus radicis (ex Gao et al. 2016)]
MGNTQNGSRGRPDFLLLILAILLAGFGLVMVFSASSNVALVAQKFNNDAFYFLKKQLLWALLGVFTMLFMMNLPYKFYKKGFIFLFIPVLIMLLIVPFTEPINGASSWLPIGPLRIQPTELAKLALILYLGSLIAKKDEKFRDFKKGLLPVLIIIGLVCGLIMLQPDLGSCMILAATAIVMIIAGGANLKHIFMAGSIIGVILTVVVSLSMAFQAPEVWAYRIARFTAYMDPLADKENTGLQLVSSLQALGHGGLTGAGFGESVQKLHYLTYPYNDFIFSIIAEEFGFLGSALFILTYLFFLWRGLIVALRCPDQYGTIVGVGIVASIGIQAFINIGGVTGTIPLTGVTLPFISAGGTSLFVCLMSVGVLLSISREHNKQERPKRSNPTVMRSRI